MKNVRKINSKIYNNVTCGFPVFSVYNNPSVSESESAYVYVCLSTPLVYLVGYM